MRSMFLLLILMSRLSAAEPTVGSAAPELSSTTSHNTSDLGPVRLSALRGQVVLLDFWAIWCDPCVDAIPHMQALHDAYAAKGLVVVGHIDVSSRGLPAFIAKHRITYPISVGSDIAGAYGDPDLPHAVLIDREGKIAWRGLPSALTEAQIEAQLASQP